MSERAATEPDQGGRAHAGTALVGRVGEHDVCECRVVMRTRT